jgi:hypothetical protein
MLRSRDGRRGRQRIRNPRPRRLLSRLDGTTAGGFRFRKDCPDFTFCSTRCVLMTPLKCWGCRRSWSHPRQAGPDGVTATSHKFRDGSVTVCPPVLYRKPGAVSPEPNRSVSVFDTESASATFGATPNGGGRVDRYGRVLPDFAMLDVPSLCGALCVSTAERFDGAESALIPTRRQ